MHILNRLRPKNPHPFVLWIVKSNSNKNLIWKNHGAQRDFWRGFKRFFFVHLYFQILYLQAQHLFLKTMITLLTPHPQFYISHGFRLLNAGQSDNFGVHRTHRTQLSSSLFSLLLNKSQTINNYLKILSSQQDLIKSLLSLEVIARHNVLFLDYWYKKNFTFSVTLQIWIIECFGPFK